MNRLFSAAVSSLVIAIAGLTPAAQASLYDFESLSAGNLIGQDNWIHANTLGNAGNEMVVGAGTGSNTSKVAIPNAGNDQVYRQNNGTFSIPTFTGTEKIYTEADFAVGTQLSVFGLLQAPGGASYSATSPWIGLAPVNGPSPPFPTTINFTFRPSFVPGGGASVTVAAATAAPEVVLGDWVRMRMELDLAGNAGNGSASVFYKDLTQGQTSFTAIAGMQNLNAGILANSAANKYFWDSMFLRGSIGNGNNAVDNLEVGLMAVPEPGCIFLSTIGLMGIAGYVRRIRFVR